MTTDSGRLSGSREPRPSYTGLGLSGFDPERIREVFPISGYAPGDYMGSCYNCKKQFIGAKLSVQCFDCAVVGLKTASMQYINEEREKAIAMEARSGETEGLDPKDDSAGPQDIAR